MAILLGLTFVQRLLGFGRSVLFCMWLSPEELGQWDVVFGFLMLAAPIAVLSLPGSFGRYVQYYDRRGQLRTFLRRTTTAVVILAVLSITGLVVEREWFSQLIFGEPNHTDLVLIAAASLAAIIAYNFIGELFIALRLQRLASSLEFCSSLGFAVIGAVLVAFWKPTAASVVIAYGSASLLAVLIASAWVIRGWRDRPLDVEAVPHGAFWGKLLPFIAWVWVSNWLANLFTIVDRYMIIHHSGMSPEDSLAVVGQYHSSRIIPVLLVTISSLLATTITPFLSHAWEAGRHSEVCQRINMLLKVVGLALLAAATLVMLAAPLLFGVVLKGKFDGGLAVLAGTLMYSIWFGMTCIAKTYLWCDEKVGLVSGAYVCGLLLNVGINLALLPTFGLWGAVIGTGAAHALALLLIYLCSMRRGMTIDYGTWFVSFMPLTLLLGPMAALASVAYAALLLFATQALFTREEKSLLFSAGGRYVTKAKAFWSPVDAVQPRLD